MRLGFTFAMYAMFAMRQLSLVVPPPLPCGLQPDEYLFFFGETQTIGNGQVLSFGDRGQVWGPTKYRRMHNKGIAMFFPGMTCIVECMFSDVCHNPLPPFHLFHLLHLWPVAVESISTITSGNYGSSIEKGKERRDEIQSRCYNDTTTHRAGKRAGKRESRRKRKQGKVKRRRKMERRRK